MNHRGLRTSFIRLAGAALMAASLVSCGASSPAPTLEIDTELEDRVLTALGAAFPEDVCAELERAESRIRGILDGLGLTDWTITRSPEVVARPTACVAPAVRVADREIRMWIGVDPAIRTALETFADEMLAGCLKKDEAVTRLKALAAGLGIDPVEVRADGPVGGPNDKLEAILAHVGAGCAIYSGSGRTADGIPIYYIAGG